MALQAFSGVIRMSEQNKRNGSAVIAFDNLPQREQAVSNGGDEPGFSDGTMHQPVRVKVGIDGVDEGAIVTGPGKGKNFVGVPAYIVNIREWHQEDRTSFTPGGGETDEFILNSRIRTATLGGETVGTHLEIEWHLGDDKSARISEIGFLCVGVPHL